MWGPSNPTAHEALGNITLKNLCPPGDGDSLWLTMKEGIMKSHLKANMGGEEIDVENAKEMKQMLMNPVHRLVYK